jgi:HPt (histidine-containing phosphotransfer) domain-containing protein
MLNTELFKSSYEDFDQEIINEIIQMFFEDYRQALENIQNAIRRNDPQLLSQVAHKYKGTVSSMYDAELKNTVQKLENLGKQGDLTGADAILQLVAEQSEILVNQLQTLVKEV